MEIIRPFPILYSYWNSSLGVWPFERSARDNAVRFPLFIFHYRTAPGTVFQTDINLSMPVFFISSPLMNQAIPEDALPLFSDQSPGPELLDARYRNLSLMETLLVENPEKETALLILMAGKSGLTFVDSPKTGAGNLTEIIPAQVATRFGVLPLDLDQDENRLTVATSDPLNFQQQAAVQRDHDGPLAWVVSPAKAIASGICTPSNPGPQAA